VAWGIIVAATAEVGKGKGYWIQGEVISEVDVVYGELAGRLIVPENSVLGGWLGGGVG